MEARGEEPILPPNPASYLTAWLFEIGPGGGMDGPISWQDMEAWQRLTGIELEPWEARLLRDLSGEYLAERHQARKIDRVPPYSGEIADIERRRAVVDDKINSAFAGLVGKKG